MLFNCSDTEIKLFEKVAFAARKIGVPAYVVGGFVRDKILGRPTKDIDIVCVGDGIALANAVAKLFTPTAHIAIFKTYGTAQLKADGVELEFVGARKESYTPESRNPEVEPGTLEDDQLRRDFTINALAMSLNEENYGEVLDPFNGLKHLQQKLLITPQEPDQTFSDDPLRMMRALRFAAQLQFTIEPYTFASIKSNAERIRIISQERITTELNKIMLSKKPSIGFDLLDKSDLLPKVFSQVSDLKGVDRIGGQCHKDNFYHTLQVLDNVAQTSNDLWLRWAALLHDIAKPATKSFEPGHGWTFHNHEHVGAKMVPRIFAKLGLPMGAEMRFVQKLVMLHLRPISLTKNEVTDSAVRRLLFDAAEDLEALLLLCNADVTSKDAKKVARIRENFELVKSKLIDVEERDKIRNWEPPISGELIMSTFGIAPSKIVGDIKLAIREAILDGKISNDYQQAYDMMLELGDGLGLKAVGQN
jgi:poly(A) polymerase